MPKDINIHLKTKGAAETKQDLDQTGKAAKGVGDATGTATGRFKAFAKSLVSWVGAFIGISAMIGGITKAIRINAQAMEEHATLAQRFQKQLLSLQFMGDFFTEHPEARKEIAAYAEFGRRPAEEVAKAWYALESKGAGLTKEQKEGIMREALELGRMEPMAGLEGIVEIFSLYMKETQDKDANLVQNIIRQTVTKAGAELAQVAQYMPEFLPVGMAGGLTGPQAAGVWAYATTKLKEPAKATMGIRNVMLALQGKGTPEMQELLEQLAVPADAHFFEQLRLLAAQRQAGRFALPQAEMIAGKENAAMLLSMLTSPEAMMETVESVAAVATGQIDIVKDALDQVMGADEFARLEEESRRLQVQIQNIKAQKIDPLRWRVHLAKLEATMRRHDIPEYEIRMRLWGEQVKRDLGWDIGEFEKHYGPLMRTSGESESSVSTDRTAQRDKGRPAGPSPPPEPQEIQEPPIEQPVEPPEPQEREQQEPPGPAPTPPPIEQPVEQPVERIVETPGVERFRPAQPPGQAAAPVSVNYDNRTINYRIINPLVGMNKVDLLIEPPTMSA